MKRKKQAKRTDVLAGKRDPVSQLYRAVRRYVEHHKGNIVVVGGIQLHELDITRGKYLIAVQCLGRPPRFEQSSHNQG